MKQRVHIVIHGAVQGVGFRPFVYRLASEMSLDGWVKNSTQGVFIEAEGDKQSLDSFLIRIEKEKPQRSFIQSFEFSFLEPVGYSHFEIRQSDPSGEISALVLPDIATCPECLREILDPSNRRYRYPFTNCTHCGPRYSIIQSLPYDRLNTSMKRFVMCPECQREYDDPNDRRFHAQPNACPICGPAIELWDEKGNMIAQRDDAMTNAADALRNGRILAIKGIGGFHLMVDARNEEQVALLRRRKRREEKPLALMFPAIDTVRRVCEISDLEERLLLSSESPIVLLKRKSEIGNNESFIAPSIALRNPFFGVMLPYSPLHSILLRELGFPVVATSGNLSDEPICIDEHEALKRLNGIADLFLVHNRPILRHVDDSIVRVMMGRELVLRRARGYAPLPVPLINAGTRPMLAVGAHLKNSVAISNGRNVFVSQHIGDLETAESFGAFRNAIHDLTRMYDIEPKAIVCDLHPDYLSTRYAQSKEIEIIKIQHHFAHIVSCMAENQLAGEVLGVAWDGTGYGTDGTVWGGEFLRTDSVSFQRVAHLRQFKLPGGEKSIKEPRRTAIGLFYELNGELVFERNDLLPLKSFTAAERALLRQILAKNINCPVTSSAGRLFDAVSSMIGLKDIARFEGQAAMELEFAAGEVETDESYPFVLLNRTPIVVDWEPMINQIEHDLKKGTAQSSIATKFHNTLVEMICGVAQKIGISRVVLSGGCFQNKYLTERTVARLTDKGFQPYWHQRVPPNDGGIALGQMSAAINREALISASLSTQGMKINISTTMEEEMFR